MVQPFASEACPHGTALEDLPMHAPADASEASASASAFAPALQPGDELIVPKRKRLTFAYVDSAEGGEAAKELVLYYGTKEVSFDDPALFPFGEQLVKQTRFLAESAVSWGDGYTWPQVQELLEQLTEAGILRRAADENAEGPGGLAPAPVLPSRCPFPRMWSAAECDPIMRDITGRGVELGYLEAIMPLGRIAHPALDMDGRQVGEANVWPMHLRMDIPTEWRICQYPGSRHLDDFPMNVTALKAMIRHWKPIMATLLAIRRAVLERMRATGETWTLLEMHAFVNVVLGLPAYMMLRRETPVRNGALHPVLSSMFRISDGVRMTVVDMLFPRAVKAQHFTDTVITAKDVHEHAERANLLLSGAGVCAGPKALIDEFLTTIFTGVPVQGSAEADLAPEIREALNELPKALDYAFLGQKMWTVTGSMWLHMLLAYQHVFKLLEATSAPADSALGLLHERIRTKDSEWVKADVAVFVTDLTRQQQIFGDGYAHARRALRVPSGPVTLAECIDSASVQPRADTGERLRRLLSRGLPDTPQARAAADEIALVLAAYYRKEQAILRAVTQIQAEINTLLERDAPTRPLSGADLHIVYLLREGLHFPMPYMGHAIADALGLAFTCTRDGVELGELVSN
jgi:hypothetical protein